MPGAGGAGVELFKGEREGASRNSRSSFLAFSCRGLLDSMVRKGPIEFNGVVDHVLDWEEALPKSCQAWSLKITAPKLTQANIEIDTGTRELSGFAIE